MSNYMSNEATKISAMVAGHVATAAHNLTCFEGPLQHLSKDQVAEIIMQNVIRQLEWLVK